MLKNGFLLIGGFIFMRKLYFGDKMVLVIGFGIWYMGNLIVICVKEIKVI